MPAQQEISRAIIGLRKHFLEKYPSFEDEFDINGNICDQVAHALKRAFPSAELYDIYSVPFGYAHTICKIGGRFYDAVDKEGVVDWHNLAYIGEREFKMGAGPYYIRGHVR